MIVLRSATPADLPLLRRWDEQPHVLASDPNDDWAWETELARSPDWREQLIAELDGRPIGFVQVIDPAREESRYWGDDVANGLRALDIWIGEAADLGRGYGTQIMDLALERCFRDPAVHAVLLDPLAANTRAHRFYERLGFEYLERRQFGEDDCLVYQLTRERWQSRRAAVREAGGVHPAAHHIAALYERHAHAYDRDRGRSLQERAWLDRFLAFVPSGGSVLDLGCGMGEPIARYLLEQGRRVVGVDAAPTMIALCRARFGEHAAGEWYVGDMRTIELGRRFAGVLAWDSFFHLPGDDQRAMFGRFAALAAPGAPLLFTSGTTAGVAIGEYQREPLHHASLDSAEYGRLLVRHGFTVRAQLAADPACGGHTVWLATREDADVA